jgi:hypothetical protein
MRVNATTSRPQQRPLHLTGLASGLFWPGVEDARRWSRRIVALRGEPPLEDVMGRRRCYRGAPGLSGKLSGRVGKVRKE